MSQNKFQICLIFLQEVYLYFNIAGRATRTPHLTLHTQTGGRAIMRTMLNNGSDEHHPGSEALVDVADHQDALLSDDGSTYSLEQEKLQQLKNVMTKTNMNNNLYSCSKDYTCIIP